MNELLHQMTQTQRYFISRMGMDERDYVSVPVQDIVAQSQSSLSEAVYSRMAEIAANQDAIHSDVRQLFGAPVCSLQREDDLFMMLELLESLNSHGVRSIKLGWGGLFRTCGAEVLIGTAPIRRFNAYVVPTAIPAQLLLLFDDEIAITLSKLARGFAGRLVEEGDRIVLVDDETAIENGASKQFFEVAASVLLGMLFDGNGREGLVVEIPGAFEESAMAISQLSMQFVLLHEIGHVALGHLGDPHAVRLVLPDSPISEWTIDHWHELEADAEALSAFRVYARSKAQPDLLSGLAFGLPLALFAAIDVLLLLVDTEDPENTNFQGMNYITDTHPSPSVRIANLLSLISLGGQDMAQFHEGFRFCTENLITAAQRCARMIRESEHFDGLEIHPRWQNARDRIRNARIGEQARSGAN